jgi:hypothetical protein
MSKIRPICDFRNIFAEKSGENIDVFFSNYCYCKNLIITLVFEKNAEIFAENWRKSMKIVIITSTPGHPDAMPAPSFNCMCFELTFRLLVKVWRSPVVWVEPGLESLAPETSCLRGWAGLGSML